GSHRLDPSTCHVIAWSEHARTELQRSDDAGRSDARRIDARRIDAQSIVVHAGSGRELPAAIAFCQATGSPLVELSTGSDLETG
ncbi:dihydrodipicolinate reductase, partial [Paraburkholderia sp. SIMBA_050]